MGVRLLAVCLAVGACGSPPARPPSVAASAPAPEETLRLAFDYRIGSLYRFGGIKIWIDGDEVYSAADLAELALPHVKVPSGAHRLLFAMVLGGTGAMEQFKWRACSKRDFHTAATSTLSLEIVAFEQGSVLTPFHERPAVHYAAKTIRGRDVQGTQAEQSGPSGTDAERCRTLSLPQ